MKPKNNPPTKNSPPIPKSNRLPEFLRQAAVLIPAIKKNGAFADDLIKKLAGVSLFERAIAKAKKLVRQEDIYVITDSDEISLICKRHSIQFFLKPDFKLEFNNLMQELSDSLKQIATQVKTILVLWPYTPLLSLESITTAYQAYQNGNFNSLVTLRQLDHKLYKFQDQDLKGFRFSSHTDRVCIEVRALNIFNSELVLQPKQELRVCPFHLDPELLEIQNYQDWWVCEKLIRRKRVLFRIIGHPEVGMGHIYRSLALAHEITDHEILFICDLQSKIATDQVTGYEYWIDSVAEGKILERIIELKPDLVINDVLDTEQSYIDKLKKADFKVLNFEDLGPGSATAHITINELFDEPRLKGENYLWGHEFFFLREEFSGAKKHSFKKRVERVLICFGGTDNIDLTRYTLNAILPFCVEQNLALNIVTGGGYGFKKELDEYISSVERIEIEYSYATGIISDIMERCEIAISSNGRTVYELAHLNIPSIIISQHPREATHCFSQPQNGFLNLGIFNAKQTKLELVKALNTLVLESETRQKLFKRMQTFDFSNNKKKVVEVILNLLGN
jgi:spore coat polysaccharide biosynthesis predicted glycosyltransferase SpsG/CMP-N-acetylneuraminic acid synthetase